MLLDTKKLVIPTKQVQIVGFEDTVTIYPIGGFALIKLKQLATKLQDDSQSAESQEECIRFALKWGCKCSEEDINFLVENALISSLELTKAIIQYSSEYNDAKLKESSLAKKKQKKQSQVKTQKTMMKN